MEPSISHHLVSIGCNFTIKKILKNIMRWLDCNKYSYKISPWKIQDVPSLYSCFYSSLSYCVYCTNWYLLYDFFLKPIVWQILIRLGNWGNNLFLHSRKLLLDYFPIAILLISLGQGSMIGLELQVKLLISLLTKDALSKPFKLKKGKKKNF